MAQRTEVIYRRKADTLLALIDGQGVRKPEEVLDINCTEVLLLTNFFDVLPRSIHIEHGGGNSSCHGYSFQSPTGTLRYADLPSAAMLHLATNSDLRSRAGFCTAIERAFLLPYRITLRRAREIAV